MNQIPSRRFSNGLSSGLSILAIFAVGYSLGGPVIAADDPSTGDAKPAQINLKSPSTFKDLPDSKGAIAAKRIDEASGKASAPQKSESTLAVDANKGVMGTTSSSDEKGELYDFHATAYCLKGRTASGQYTRPGIIAADPRVLPIGTVVQIRAGRYSGTYTVLDTGTRIKGRKVDIYVPSYHEARRFGRQKVKIKVISSTRRRAGR